MHSRIFQLEKNIEEVEDNLLIEDEIIGNYDWFFCDIADYVSDISEKEEEENIKWFIDSMKEHCSKFFKADEKQKHITFLPGFKNKYFEERFKYFEQQVKEVNLNDFCERWPKKIYSIKNVIEDKFGFYVFNEDDGLITLDSFVRSLPNDEQVTYYFGSVLDYHF